METDSCQGPVSTPHPGKRTQRLALLEFGDGK